MFRLHFIYISVFNLLNWLLCPYPVFPASMIQWYVIKCMNKTNKYPKVAWCQTYIPPPPPRPPKKKKKKKKHIHHCAVCKISRQCSMTAWIILGQISNIRSLICNGHICISGHLGCLRHLCTCQHEYPLTLKQGLHRGLSVLSTMIHYCLSLHILLLHIYIDRQLTHHKRFWKFTGKSNY